MTLKEELQKKRVDATTITDEELEKIVTASKNIFIDMQERNIDKQTLLVEVDWDNDKLKVNTKEPDIDSIAITEIIKSNNKKKMLLQAVEEKLKTEGVSVKRINGVITWVLDLS